MMLWKYIFKLFKYIFFYYFIIVIVKYIIICFCCDDKLYLLMYTISIRYIVKIGDKYVFG